MSVHSLFILADDLTGAADSAIGATRAGLESVVLFGAQTRQTQVCVEADVFAIDAETRYLPEMEARAINARLWAAYAAPGRLFYKKIDSTLRGNFAAEIAALTQAGAGVAIVAPAYPTSGRTTKRGRVYVDDIPLEHTKTWSNEGLCGEADLVAMLRRVGVVSTGVPLPLIRGDLRGEFIRLLDAKEVQAIVCDAENESDLSAIVAASRDLPVYWVGSSGLSSHLISSARIVGQTTAPSVKMMGPILTIIGSISDVSRQQAARLEASGNFAIFEPDAEMLLAGESDSGWQSMQRDLLAALGTGRDTIVRTVLKERNDLSQGPSLGASIGRMLSPAASRVGALIVTGGETAMALLPVFGVQALRLWREIEPGVPLSVTMGERVMPMITKAGGFGSPDVFLACYAQLASLREENCYSERCQQ